MLTRPETKDKQLKGLKGRKDTLRAEEKRTTTPRKMEWGLSSDVGRTARNSKVASRQNRGYKLRDWPRRLEEEKEKLLGSVASAGKG